MYRMTEKSNLSVSCLSTFISGVCGRRGTGGASVRIAILDSGHDELHSRGWPTVEDKLDFTDSQSKKGPRMRDHGGRGTHILGVVAECVPTAAIFVGKICRGREIKDHQAMAKVSLYHGKIQRKSNFFRP